MYTGVEALFYVDLALIASNETNEYDYRYHINKSFSVLAKCLNIVNYE